MKTDPATVLYGGSFSHLVLGGCKPVDDFSEFEEAARHLCGLKGINPEGLAGVPSRDGFSCFQQEPLWKSMARQIQDAMHIQEAIALLEKTA